MRVLVIPAAGRGSRLGGDTPKPLVMVDGRPMLEHLVALYEPFVQHVVVVAHPSFTPAVDAWRAGRNTISIAEQHAATGMLDAILAAAPAVRRLQPTDIWITWADQVGVLPNTVKRLAHHMAAAPAPAAALPTVRRADPYIHFERDTHGRISRLLQRREGDTMPNEGESDMGLFALSAGTFTSDLEAYAAQVDPGRGTGERNFLPFVPWLAQRKPIVTFACTDPMEAVGINTPDELARVEAWLRQRGPRG